MPRRPRVQGQVVTAPDKGLQGLLKAAGVTIVEGEGRLVGPDRGRRSATRRYEGRHVVLATGSVPKSLPGLEIDGERVITSDHALDAGPRARRR